MAESDKVVVYSFAAVYRGYRQCRRRKRGTANAQRYEHRLLDHLVDTTQALQDRIDTAEARDLSWLTQVILKQDFKTETHYRCTPAALARVPEHKRLTAAPPGKGLPIGNLTSQFLANVYLNELDQFVKHQLKCRYYLRYVDDLMLLDPDPERLHGWGQAIAGFLQERLQLALKPDWVLRPVTDGADFLGYIVRPDYRLVRRRVVGNLRAKLAAFAQGHVSATGLRLPAADREQLRAQLASYLGHFAHADAWRLAHSLFDRHAWLGLIFRLREGCLVPRWEPPTATSLRAQVGWFRRACRPAIPLVQIGNRIALFEPDLGLALTRAPWLGRWRGARPEPRPGLPPGLSWPVTCIKGLGRSLRQAEQAYALIAEEGYLPGGIKRRVLRYLFIGTAPVVSR